MTKERLITWYLSTIHAYTNEVISRELPAENASRGVKCFDGEERNLWECDGAFVTKMLKNRKSLNLDFKIFKKEGKYGKIKEVTFLNKNKKRKPKSSKRVGKNN